jgi:hypothetical protein
MKVQTYLRVAEGARGPRVVASAKPNYQPLTKGAGTYHEEALPTAMFAVVLDIPDELFERASQVLAEIEVPTDRAEIAAEVPRIEDNEQEEAVE